MFDRVVYYRCFSVGVEISHQSLQRVQLCTLNIGVQLLDDERQQKLYKEKKTRLGHVTQE